MGLKEVRLEATKSSSSGENHTITDNDVKAVPCSNFIDQLHAYYDYYVNVQPRSNTASPKNGSYKTVAKHKLTTSSLPGAAIEQLNSSILYSKL